MSICVVSLQHYHNGASGKIFTRLNGGKATFHVSAVLVGGGCKCKKANGKWLHHHKFVQYLTRSSRAQFYFYPHTNKFAAPSLTKGPHFDRSHKLYTKERKKLQSYWNAWLSIDLANHGTDTWNLLHTEKSAGGSASTAATNNEMNTLHLLAVAGAQLKDVIWSS